MFTSPSPNTYQLRNNWVSLSIASFMTQTACAYAYITIFPNKDMKWTTQPQLSQRPARPLFLLLEKHVYLHENLSSAYCPLGRAKTKLQLLEALQRCFSQRNVNEISRVTCWWLAGTQLQAGFLLVLKFVHTKKLHPIVLTTWVLSIYRYSNFYV